MRVLELLNEIVEIVDTASTVPLTGKIMVDSKELLEIVEEIKMELPKEMQDANWIITERQRILDEAKKEYDTVINDAKEQAEALIKNDEIITEAKRRAETMLQAASANAKQLKMGTYDYVDSILYDFQAKMDTLNAEYFAKLYEGMDDYFNKINATLSENREEIKELAFRAQNDMN